MSKRGRIAGASVVLAAMLALSVLGGRSGHADEAKECLARAIYFEARDEGEAGMNAVASVVFNRIESADFPNEVCAVVKEGGESPPCQFSWWCDGRSDQPDDPELWRQAEQVADRWLSSPPPDPTGKALYFHARGADAPYHEEREFVAEIGGHLFYR